MAKIGFLGTGAMGSRMAVRLVQAGHTVTVWNRSPERLIALAAAGCVVAPTPAKAAAGGGFVIAMVRDDAASRHVWLDRTDGALAAMEQSAIAIDCSTLSVGWAKELATSASTAKVAFLDAPLAGSRPQAEAGQLIFFAGGEADVAEMAKPVFQAMGSAVHHSGGPGSGAAIKLAVNALFGIQVAAIAELLGMLAASGIDGAKAMEIIGATPVASQAVKGAAAGMLAGNFAPQFPIELVVKDFAYAAALGQKLPLTRAAEAVFEAALKKGHGADNLTAVARLYGRVN